MTHALIGCSGFVGSTLLKQAQFEALFRSTNIGDIAGKDFDIVVCAGAPAQKWIANAEPEADRLKIEGLISHLKQMKCKTFILISTVDVFKHPVGIDEHTFINEYGLHAYGLHRRVLEKFVESHFSHHLIVRLPGLVGPGLRKNIIFDCLHNNNLHMIESRNIFQFYPMVNLWHDIQVALKAGLQLIHLTAEPISVQDVFLKGFGKVFNKNLGKSPITYDMQTRYANIFGVAGAYQYTARETIQAIRCYAQSEPIEVNV
jgi:nucleoside-diphosphate-sugar epimerase